MIRVKAPGKSIGQNLPSGIRLTYPAFPAVRRSMLGCVAVLMEGTMAALDSFKPGVSPEHRMPGAPVWRILKLRWMGLENEAQCLEEEFRHVKCAGSVLDTPLETD